MASVNVSPEELRQLSLAYAQTADQLRARLAQLNAQSVLLRLEWVGSSSSVFQHLNAQLETSRRQLLEALDGMAKALAAASKAYESADSAISSAFE